VNSILNLIEEISINGPNLTILMKLVDLTNKEINMIFHINENADLNPVEFS
jgi:hypothetical protein